MPTDKKGDGWIDEVIREIQEMPDRTSPEDFPEAMLITGPELRRMLKHYAPQSAVAPTKQTAMLGVIEDALEDFPEGNDLYGVYAEWKMKLDGALGVIREHFRDAPVVPSATLATRDEIIEECAVEADNYASAVFMDKPEGWQYRENAAEEVSKEIRALKNAADRTIQSEKP